MRPGVCAQRGELIAGDAIGVINVWVGNEALDVLSEEGPGSDGSLVALITGGDRNDVRDSGRLLLVTCARGHMRMTPRSAQLRNVWPSRQSQHNRNENCSE